MATIDITKLLSVDLKSRSAVIDLRAYVLTLQAEYVEMDFDKVQFATRSFMDEYYRVFVVGNEWSGKSIKTINVPTDILAMLQSVEKTQYQNLKPKESNTRVHSFQSLNELKHFVVSVLL